MVTLSFTTLLFATLLFPFPQSWVLTINIDVCHSGDIARPTPVLVHLISLAQNPADRKQRPQGSFVSGDEIAILAQACGCFAGSTASVLPSRLPSAGMVSQNLHRRPDGSKA
jgi:hypothetical protein